MKLPDGFGLGMPHQNAEEEPGYYDRMYEWFDPPCTFNWLKDLDYENYFPMQWAAGNTAKDRDKILASPAAATEKIWFVGNEPEGLNQSNTEPLEFVRAIKYWEQSIKLPFAIPGILWDTGGYNWWREYKRLGGPTPDAYHIHIYAADSEDWSRLLGGALTIFTDRPLIITECGGWGVIPSLQAGIMNAVWESIYLKRLIPAAFWFSSRYGPWKEYWRATDLHGEYLGMPDRINELGRSYNYTQKKKVVAVHLPFISA